MIDRPQIYGALAAVMADCREVAKRDRNEQQHFVFRGVDAVVNAVGPILREHRVVVIPEVDEVAYVQVQTSTGKPQTSCRVVVRYVFYAEDGSSVAARVAAESSDSGDKATPKAMSVAFRVALLQALALPTDSPDPDAGEPAKAGRKKSEAPPDEPPQETRRMSRPPARQKTPRESQEAKMFALFKETGYVDKDDMLAYIGTVVGRPIESRTDITDDELAAVVAELQVERAGA